MSAKYLSGKMISRDEWPDCVRSVTHSHHIAETQFPDGIVASYLRQLRGFGAIMLSLLAKTKGSKEPGYFDGIRIGSIHMIS